MSLQRPLDEIVEKLSNAKEAGRSCSLLVGAGCSVSAGIPSAGGFVKRIREQWPAACGRAPEANTYPECMARLSADARHDLIAEYVHKAKINWAHVGIACLVKHGYVDRILTTNFDPLVVRACAMLGEFPAIYDIASSESFKPEKIRGQAVFYLHGQQTGSITLSTEAEVREQSIGYRP